MTNKYNSKIETSKTKKNNSFQLVSKTDITVYFEFLDFINILK